ncbi:DUF3231 family protein [Alkalibacillus aidingensis]|uniref:DUF3231 family protein n=1 Tax=Alkalibacillus aidingensis TaxID=2747607 RepID=UPI0016616AD7|nr:DUF3231 family protein [Alkalibacillus aidingensis]
MGKLSGNPKEQPLHYGEVYQMWSFLAAEKLDYAKLQTLSNHTGDRDLKRLLEEMLQGMEKQMEDVEEILKEHGVSLPPTPPERSYADLEEIPSGAKFNDPEISAMASAILGKGLVLFSTIMSQCTREDLAMLFGQYHMNTAQLSGKALRLNKEKGWLVVPPLHK